MGPSATCCPQDARRRTSVAGAVVSLLFALGADAPAQDGGQEGFERVEFRVTSVGAGGAIEIDRGSVDGVEVGDMVFLLPRGGGSYRGRVVQTATRSAILEMDQTGYLPETGTRGRVRVPAARLDQRAPVDPEPVSPTPPPTRDPAEEPAQEQHDETRPTSEWSRPDDGWTPGKPLLSLVRPERPEDRGMQVSGRVFTVSELTDDEDQGLKNSFLRSGVVLLLENPFGNGGAINFDGEIDYRTERDESRGFDLLPRRISYRYGGDRFRTARYEFGRFLQYGMAEFGVLDGAEWSDRTRAGHRYGASVGFLPELDEDLDTGQDLQFAGFYQWVADNSERISVKVGYQKTFHNGKADRDLVVVKGHYLPLDPEQWSFWASVWVDIYYGRDDEKNGGPELTQAYASARRTWGSRGGLDIDYRRIRFYEALRNEFLPLAAGELANNRYDRLTLDGWRRWTDFTRVRALVSGWDDEDHDGGALQLGFESEEWLSEGSRTEVAGFASFNEFSNSAGGRVTHFEYFDGGSWDLLYELSNHHLIGVEDDRDDFIQHRVRGGYNVFTDDGWTFSLYGQVHQWDEELSWTLGLQAQKTFRLRKTYLE